MIVVKEPYLFRDLGRMTLNDFTGYAPGIIYGQVFLFLNNVIYFILLGNPFSD